MSKKIGIVGSRRRYSRDDFNLVKNKFLDYYEEGDIIVSGGCKTGADRFAETIARDMGITIIIHHANWDKNGKQAGFIRNTKIADDSDWLIACVSSDRKGGTEDTIRKFEKLEKTKWVKI